MPTSTAARHRTPYGLAFPLEDLMFVRGWAAEHGMSMSVLLDQVLDGAEFEELLLIRGPTQAHRALTIWRTAGSVVAQAAGAHPRAFTCVPPALAHFQAMLAASAAKPRPTWRLRLESMWHRLALAAERRGVHV